MFTRATTTSSSRNAVFNTAELLENILLHLLKETDIITARGVNKHWNAVIMTSPLLQRKLFLAPEPVTERWIVNPPTSKPRFALTQDSEEALQNSKGDFQWTVPARLNPMLFVVDSQDPRQHQHSHSRGGRRSVTMLPDRPTLHDRVRECETVRLRAMPDLRRTPTIGKGKVRMTHSGRGGEAKQEESGVDSIHKRMLVCQPPSSTVTLDFVYLVSPKRETFNHHEDDHDDNNNETEDDTPPPSKTTTPKPKSKKHRRRPPPHEIPGTREEHLELKVSNRTGQGVTFGDLLQAFYSKAVELDPGQEAVLARWRDPELLGTKKDYSVLPRWSKVLISGVVFATEEERGRVGRGLV